MAPFRREAGIPSNSSARTGQAGSRKRGGRRRVPPSRGLPCGVAVMGEGRVSAGIQGPVFEPQAARGPPPVRENRVPRRNEYTVGPIHPAPSCRQSIAGAGFADLLHESDLGTDFRHQRPDRARIRRSPKAWAKKLCHRKDRGRPETPGEDPDRRGGSSKKNPGPFSPDETIRREAGFRADGLPRPE